jgi:hypothetical protein
MDGLAGRRDAAGDTVLNSGDESPTLLDRSCLIARALT